MDWSVLLFSVVVLTCDPLQLLRGVNGGGGGGCPCMTADGSSCVTAPPGWYCPVNGGQIAPCDAGSYSNQYQVRECTKCDPGTYQPQTAQSSCLPAPPGAYVPFAGSFHIYYCSPGTFAASDRSLSCTICPAGTYAANSGQSRCDNCVGSAAAGATRCSSAEGICPPGWYFETSSSTCRSCPVGTYSAIPGAVDGCTKCPPGTFVEPSATSGATLLSAACRACAAGSFSDVDSAAACTPCAMGSYGTSVGASGSERCVACPAGTASRIVGANAVSLCGVCPPGTFSFAGAINCTPLAKGTFSSVSGLGGPFGVSCPAGTFGTRDGANASSDCQGCAPGTYSSAVGATSNATCQPCPVGTYNAESGSSSVASCLLCPSGTYSPLLGASRPDACAACPVGTYSLQLGAAACQQLPAGYYSNLVGLGSVLGAALCPPGTFSGSTGASDIANCTFCPMGTYNPINGATSARSCLPCPVGSFSALIGASRLDQCIACSAGSFANATGSSSCTLCHAGSASAVVGSATPLDCIPCRPGKSAPLRGMDECVVCPAGYFSNQSGSIRCDACPRGATSSMSATACMLCIPGTYSNYSGAVLCSGCPRGTYQPDAGASSCRTCGDVLSTVPLPLDPTRTTIDAAACTELRVTIPLNYGVLAAEDVARVLSPVVTVTLEDGSSPLPSYLNAVVTGGGAYVLISAVELPAVPLDAANAANGVSQIWSVTLQIAVLHSCLPALNGSWIGRVMIRVTQTPPRFAALSSGNAAGLHACPHFDATLLASLGSCGAKVSLGAVVTNIVLDTSNTTTPSANAGVDSIQLQSTSAGGLLSIFGRAPLSGVAEFTVVGVAQLLHTNVTSDGIIVKVRLADSRPAIRATVSSATGCPYVSIRFVGTPAVCGSTIFSVLMSDGRSPLPPFLTTFVDGSDVIVSGSLPTNPTTGNELSIMATASLSDGSFYSTSTNVTLLRGQTALETAVTAKWSVGGGVYDVASAARSGGGKISNVTVSSGVVWRNINVFYGLALSVTATLSGVDPVCASVALWASSGPPSTTTTSSSSLPNWLNSATVQQQQSQSLTIVGVPPATDPVGTMYTICVYALDGAYNPCICLIAELSLSLMLTFESSSSASNGSFVITSPAAVVTAKLFLPSPPPFVTALLFMCPDSTSGALAFCQFNPATRNLAAFGTTDGVAAMLSAVRVAATPSTTETFSHLAAWNATVAVSDSVNPDAVKMGVALAQFRRYQSIQPLSPGGGYDEPPLTCKVGIAAHLPLGSLLLPTASTASAVASGNLQFSLVEAQTPQPFPLSVVGAYLDGTASTQLLGKRSFVITVLDLRVPELLVTMRGVVLVQAPKPPNATVAALTPVKLLSSDSTVIILPSETFVDPEGVVDGHSALQVAARYLVTGAGGVTESQPLPLWASFDSGSQQLSLLPTFDNVGEHDFLITAISTYGDWSGNASVVQHVTVDYSVRDLLQSLYNTFGYAASVCSAAALLFAWRNEVYHVFCYGRRMRKATPLTLLATAEAQPQQEQVYELQDVVTGRLLTTADVSCVRVRSVIAAPSSLDTTVSSIFHCQLPACVQVWLRQRNCEFEEAFGDGSVRGVAWLRRGFHRKPGVDKEANTTWTIATVTVDASALAREWRRGDVALDDVFVVEVEAAGWLLRGSVWEVFEVRIGDILDVDNMGPQRRGGGGGWGVDDDVSDEIGHSPSAAINLLFDNEDDDDSAGNTGCRRAKHAAYSTCHDGDTHLLRKKETDDGGGGGQGTRDEDQTHLISRTSMGKDDEHHWDVIGIGDGVQKNKKTRQDRVLPDFLSDDAVDSGVVHLPAIAAGTGGSARRRRRRDSVNPLSEL